MRNFPLVMFCVLVVLVAVAFLSTTFGQAQIDQAAAARASAEAQLEQARAAATIASADAFSLKILSILPYFVIGCVVALVIGIIGFLIYRRDERNERIFYEAALRQTQPIAPPVYVMMLPGPGDTRPSMAIGGPEQAAFYLVDQEASKEVVRYRD